MKYFHNNSSLGKFCFLLLSVSLLVGFYFGETASGIGAKADFYNYWPYTLALKENFYVNGSKFGTLHLPVHHMLLAYLDLIINDRYFVRLLFCVFSICLPYLFYLNLKTKFVSVSKNNLLCFASLIFILPSFRYSAIWANGHVTALIFFLLSTFFFLKWEKENSYKRININIILQVIFLALSVYTRQYYALLFVYFMIIYFQKLRFKTFLYLSVIVSLLTLPGLWIIYDSPGVLNLTFSTKLATSLLVNSSIISFFLIPIFFLLYLNNRQIFIGKKKTFLSLIFLSFVLVVFFSSSFDYNFKIGGGFLLKLSVFLFENNYLFYLSSIFGFIFIIYLCLQDKNNYIMFLILLFGFSAYMIFQKYFEPMILFIFFLIIKSNLPEEFLKNYKNILFLYIYVLFYFISAIINDVFQISLNF